jgi:hypothetical protein
MSGQPTWSKLALDDSQRTLIIGGGRSSLWTIAESTTVEAAPSFTRTGDSRGDCTSRETIPRVGSRVGTKLGGSVVADGFRVGYTVGKGLGLNVGERVGVSVGDGVGVDVGAGVAPSILSNTTFSVVDCAYEAPE